MFDYTITYSTRDYDRQPSYDCSYSYLCAFNNEHDAINPKSKEGKKQKWVYID